MSKKLIAGLLSLVLIASSGADVLAADTGSFSDDAGPAVAADSTEDADGAGDEKAASEDERAAQKEEQEAADDKNVDPDGDPAGSYRIRYNSNGGAGAAIDETVCVIGEKHQIAVNTFTKNGCTFDKWNTKTDGTGESYSSGEVIERDLTDVPDTVVDLYAIWSKTEYTITYHLNGGTNDPVNPAVYDVETATITLKAASKPGHNFTGWYSDELLTQKVETVPTGSAGNLDLYAKWAPYTYTVRFDGNGNTAGQMTDMTGCEYGKQYELASNLFQKNGYEFAGWNTQADGNGKAFTDKASFTNLSEKDGETVVLYAQWKIATYTITYNLDGGKNNSSNPTSYDITTQTITLGDATRKGYAFGGWFSDSSYSARVKQIKQGSTGDIVLYAKWNPNKYNIKFMGNGATSGKMSVMKNRRYGTEYKLSANKFKKKGYTFAGWNTKASGKGKAFANKAAVKNLTAKNNKTIKLYAQWKIKGYEITYVLNGGTNNPDNPDEYNVKSKTIVLKNAKRKGYTFKGWYSDKSFKHRVQKIPKGSTGNKTFYAKWEANRYRIRFDGNKADHGSMDDMKDCKYGTKYRLPRNEFKKDGYIFTEWNTKSDGSGKSYENKASVKNLTTKDDVTVTLYAIWTPIRYTIVFDKNGGTGEMDIMDCTYGYSYTLFGNEFTRKKFKFDCWNTKSDGSGTSYADKATVANLTTIDGDTVRLYAQWEEDFDEIPMNVSRPSQGDISSFVNYHPYSNSDAYAVSPSLAEPYSAGALSAQTQQSSLNLLNTYRYIAGIQTNVSLNDTYSDHAAKGTLLNKLNNSMSHVPSRPAVLSDPKYDQLFQDGYDGCAHSNLASGFPSMTMKGAIDMWMNDSDKDNIEFVGHRRWILYPSLSQVGFGKTDNGSGGGGSFCAAYVISGNSTSTSTTRVAWPANNTPVGFFKDDTAWSLSLGRTIESSKVKVKVIRDRDHKEWRFTSSAADGDFYVSNSGYGVPGCIIFRPKDLEVKAGESYTVKAFFYDEEEMIKYNVSFFNL